MLFLCVGGQPPSSAMVALNQLTTGSGASGGQPGASTVKRRKKSAAAPNPKKMFEEVISLVLCFLFPNYFFCMQVSNILLDISRLKWCVESKLI